MTRDPQRIPTVLEAVREFWERKPDLRLAQVIWLTARVGQDPFYVEDDQLIRVLKEAKTDG